HDGVPALRRPLEQPLGVVVVDADALHAGVDLQVDLRPHAQLARGLVDLAQLVDGRRGQREPVPQEDRDLVAEDAAHHQDGQRDAGLAERHRLLEEGDPQRRRTQAGEVTPDGDEPVAVGVALHDGHHGRPADGGLDRAEVLGQPRQADLDDGGPDVVHHFMKLGSHSDRIGKATRSASRSTSAHMNGSTPLKMVAVLSSGMSVRSTNMFMPTGGLMSPISTTQTMMMPNQMGSKPRCTTTGKNTGIVSRIIDSSSIAVPSTTST